MILSMSSCPYWPAVCMLHMLTGHLEVNGVEVYDEIQQNCEGIRYRNVSYSSFLFFFF